MSATNRGTKRNISDNYETPISVIENLLSHYDISKHKNILEPSASSGNFIKTIRSKYSNIHNITACEIRKSEENKLKNICDNVHIMDFMEYSPEREREKVDLIIGNPPYSIAQPFLEHCFEIGNKNTVIIMLLRTSFLESKKRFKFWQEHPVNKLYVLSKRPSFTGKGTDATSYSFFIWDNSNKQEIKVI